MIPHIAFLMWSVRARSIVSVSTKNTNGRRRQENYPYLNNLKKNYKHIRKSLEAEWSNLTSKTIRNTYKCRNCVNCGASRWITAILCWYRSRASCSRRSVMRRWIFCRRSQNSSRMPIWITRGIGSIGCRTLSTIRGKWRRITPGSERHGSSIRLLMMQTESDIYHNTQQHI